GTARTGTRIAHARQGSLFFVERALQEADHVVQRIRRIPVKAGAEIFVAAVVQKRVVLSRVQCVFNRLARGAQECNEGVYRGWRSGGVVTADMGEYGR